MSELTSLRQASVGLHWEMFCGGLSQISETLNNASTETTALRKDFPNPGKLSSDHMTYCLKFYPGDSKQATEQQII